MEERRGIGRWVSHGILPVVGLAFAYYGSGLLGLLLAIPPSNVTPVWPPSGIGLAGILLFGHRVWPGIVAGWFLLAAPAYLGREGFEVSAIALAIPATLALAAATQATVAAFLVRRFAGFSTALIREREILFLVLLGGPVSCLVNPTVGTLVMVAAGLLPVADAGFSWMTWWIGDSLGVLVFTPLILIWAARPREAWKGRRLATTASFAVPLALTILFGGYVASWERDRLEFQFTRQAGALAAALERTVTRHTEVLLSLANFHDATDNLTRDDFRAFATPFLERFPALQALSFNARVAGAERTDFEAVARSGGSPGFQITERGPGGNLVRAAPRPEYVAVFHITPLAGNEKAVGFDVASEPIRRTALTLARDTGEPVATAPIRLVQETGHQPGFLVFMPVYGKGKSAALVERRREAVIGYMVGVFRIGDLVATALKGLDVDGLGFRLADDAAPSEHRVLFERPPAPGRAPWRSFPPSLFADSAVLEWHDSLPVAGRQWGLVIGSTPAFAALHRPWYAWPTLVGGLLFTGLAGLAGLLVSGRGVQLRTLVGTLRDSEERLTALTGNIAEVLWLTDPESTEMQYVSPAYEHVWGRTCASLYAHPQSFLDPIHPDDRAATDRAVADLPVTGHYDVEYRIVRPDGTVRMIRDRAFPVYGDDGTLVRIAGIAEDITERKAMEAALRDALALNEKIIADSPIGIGIYESSGTCVAANDALGAQIGATRRQVLTQNFTTLETWRRTGLLDTATEALTSGAFRRREVNVVSTFGKRVALDCHFVPLAREPGSRLLLMVVDISERRAAEERLRGNNALLACVGRLQALFIDERNSADVFETLLHDLFHLTDSRYGFVTELRHDGDGRPYQQVLAISDVARDDASRRSYEEARFRSDAFDGLDAAAIVDGAPVIANAPADDPRCNGRMPEGHPPLSSFLGLPLRRGSEVIGSIGLANREGGYDPAQADHLEPVLTACAQVIDGFRNERRRLAAERALAESEKAYRQMFESNTAVKLLIDPADGSIVDANGAAEKYYGYPREKLIALPISDISTLPPERMKEEVETAKAEKRSFFRFSHRLASGEIRDVEVFSGPVEKDGRTLLYSIITDVTDRYRYERELEKKTVDLERSNTELQQFAYVASHDLQEPLRNTVAYLQLLEQRYRGKLDAEADEFIRYAVAGGKRMRALVQDLLAFSRVEAQGRTPQPTDTAEVVETALRDLRLPIEETDARVTVGAMPVVMGDEIQLVSLFENLIGNALRYRHPDRRPEIRIGARRKGEMWVFSVTDNGLGIEPQYFERIFIIFQRLHGWGDGYEGTGIGLAVCKKIVQRHGGRIWVESEPERGSTFGFTLPAPTAS